MSRRAPYHVVVDGTGCYAFGGESDDVETFEDALSLFGALRSGTIYDQWWDRVASVKRGKVQS